MGLLLVFRTNTAYNRFWEGRRIWEKILTSLRDLGRMTVLYGDVIESVRVERILHLLCAYPLGMVTSLFTLLYYVIQNRIVFFRILFQFLKIDMDDSQPLYCVCLSVHLSVCLFVCVYVRLSSCMSVCECASVYLSVCLPVCLSVCLSVCLCVCLSVCRTSGQRIKKDFSIKTKFGPTYFLHLQFIVYY